MDGTPIYDVKPYLPYADCRPEAAGGFASQPKEASLRVECPPELLGPVEEEQMCIRDRSMTRPSP